MSTVDNSMATESSTEQSRRAELRQLLDAEISNIMERRKREGWTTWALLGGIGTILWLLADRLANDSISWTNTSTLLLVLWLGYLSFALMKACFWPAEETGASSRYRPIDSYMLSAGLSFVPLGAVFIALAVKLSGNVPLLITVLTVTIQAILVLIGAGILVLRFLGLPLSASSARHRYTSYILVPLGVGCLVSSLFYLGSISSLHIEDIRVAGLLFAVMELSGRALNKTKDEASLTSFISIRRELVLGKLDLQTALTQADIVFAGVKGSDILQEDIQQYLKVYACFDENLRQQTERIDKTLAALPPKGEVLSVDQVNTLRSAIDFCQTQRKELADGFKEERQKFKDMMRRLGWVRQHIEPKETREVWGKIFRALEDFAFRKRVVDMEIDDLEQRHPNLR